MSRKIGQSDTLREYSAGAPEPFKEGMTWTPSRNAY